MGKRRGVRLSFWGFSVKKFGKKEEISGGK